MTKDHQNYLRALQSHWWSWGGFAPGKKTLQTGISPNRGLVKGLKDFFFRVTYLEAFTLNKLKIEQALNKFDTTKNFIVAGYPSAINQIAEVALAENKTYPAEAVISYGDKLFDHHRENFLKAFNSPKIINTYGCAEGLLMACQADLSSYYIMSPHVVLEIVDDQGQEVPDGEMGHILVTCLTNYAMPLIRYKLGDLGVKLKQEDYPQQRKFAYPLLEKVIGRETDVIKTPLGDTLIVHSFTGILEYLTYIKQYKVIQTAVDSILIEYITEGNSPLLKDQKKEMHNKLSKLVREAMHIQLHHVEHIAPSRSGKPQIIEIKPFS